VKQKLAEKILKQHPSIQTTLENRARANFMRGNKASTAAGTPRRPVPFGQRREVESYRKKIWNLEHQKSDLERKIHESKGRQNRLKLKLDKYSGMEQQIIWTEKAMGKLEGDRNRLEDLLKSMALNVPNKLPFQKLVTDPSILDRVAKYEVLQKRLMKQSSKVQELKRTAMKIMEVQNVIFLKDNFFEC
jgi:predicted RNase H-like nuclease (RuvC/YqgF family)